MLEKQTIPHTVIYNSRYFLCRIVFLTLSYKQEVMDAKITLSFDHDVIAKAKNYAAKNNISLSRLTEFLLNKVTSSDYKSIDELPVSDWISAVSEGEVIYQRTQRSSKELKKEFYSKKSK